MFTGDASHRTFQCEPKSNDTVGSILQWMQVIEPFKMNENLDFPLYISIGHRTYNCENNSDDLFIYECKS